LRRAGLFLTEARPPFCRAAGPALAEGRLAAARDFLFFAGMMRLR